MEPNYTNVIKKVSEILSKLNSSFPPVDIAEVAAMLELKIYILDLTDNLKKVSGFIDFDNRRIILNKLDSPKRQAFTTAHEIGHFVLHESYIKEHPEEYSVLFRNNFLSTNKSSIEKEADCFAANLLVPLEILDLYKMYPTSIIADIFQVSPQVIEFRMKDLLRNAK